MLVKICGVTTESDADSCVLLGAWMIGLNFVASSPRCLQVDDARRISAVAGRAEVVGVVADRDEADLRQLGRWVGLDRVQLCGAEPPDLVRRLGSWAMKAIRIGTRLDLSTASRYEGLILIDAKVDGRLGGTGKLVDFALAAEIAKARPIFLAGGLTPDNVGAAVKSVRPHGVDVASGVEVAPGVKDLEAVALFVARARHAADE